MENMRITAHLTIFLARNKIRANVLLMTVSVNVCMEYKAPSEAFQAQTLANKRTNSHTRAKRASIK